MEWLTDPQAWIALATLTVLEIVLGIDNVIFIAILADKVPASERGKARTIGLAGAMITRILLLLTITWIMGLTRPLFSVLSQEISGRDLILAAGGLFLLAKATSEIHDKLEGAGEHGKIGPSASLAAVIFQIMLLDVVFSLDSVITAVGMAEDIGVMVTAVVIAVGVMMLFATSVSDFVSRHPTVKMLALSFLLLIGMTLVSESVGFHIPKGYIYFAMGFSIFVEMLNLRLRGRTKPVELHGPRV